METSSNERDPNGTLLRLVEEQKREKDAALKMVLELERNVFDKQMLELEIEELKCKLGLMKHMGDDDEVVKKKIDQMNELLEEKKEKLEGLEELNTQLLTIERQINVESEDARQLLIRGFQRLTVMPTGRASIGIKKMGEIDMKPFTNACNKRFSSDDAGMKAVELTSLWQEKLENVEWYPFRVVEDEEGNSQIELKEEDESLQSLKEEWGDEVYEAVTTALKEMQEYNPDGFYVVSELWNFKENRKATLKEAMNYISGRLKMLKRQRTLARVFSIP